MKIGITGIGGFIGQHIASLALDRGYEVIGVEKSDHGCRIATARFRLGVPIEQRAPERNEFVRRPITDERVLVPAAQPNARKREVVRGAIHARTRLRVTAARPIREVEVRRDPAELDVQSMRERQSREATALALHAWRGGPPFSESADRRD